MLAYCLNSENVIKNLSSNKNTGLSKKEALNRLEKFGKNKLKDQKNKSIFTRFFDQFKDVMIIILIIAAIISFIIAIYKKDSQALFEPLLIIVIVILNAIMGVLQENKAEKSLQALKNLSAPHAKVIRDNKLQVINAEELVPGDIIKLEAGDIIPADARLLTCSSLKSEESALTGESVPVEKNSNTKINKNAAIADRVNMVFSGCSVAYGSATAIVTATGMNNEMGKIANLLKNENNSQTPLQLKLQNLGKILGLVAIIACAIIFIIGLIYGISSIEIFMVAVSLAVSAIPEGLPAIVTIVLALGVQKMAKKNAIVRRLPAVETLGSASVICSDKTGTLTQNKMTIKKAYANNIESCENISNNNSPEIIELLKFATLCCDSDIIFEKNTQKHIGDPTETAIIAALYENGILKSNLQKQFPRIFEIPFDSNRKLMSVVVNINGKNIAIVKGAFDVIANRCTKGNITKAKIFCDKMSLDALRVLAIAFKEVSESKKTFTEKELENDLCFLGLVGMIDPPRPQVKNAVKTCLKAGIKPVMITGDHIITACAIAKNIGILKDNDIAITGTQLDEMTDEEFFNKVEKISVYARVSPENKIRIVKAWQKRGKVVSMTGDGVNDAPALKAADIGCAMGITGTDVAKNSAGIILTDDNFATIVYAVKEGRGIYSNIKKVVAFLLSTNTGEILTVFLAMLLYKCAPLAAMQLLLINLVTDSLPAIAIGMEKIQENVMLKKPKPKNESIFANGLGIQIFLQGFLFAALTLVAFFIGRSKTETIAGGQTLAFLVLSLSQVVHAFNMRSGFSLFKIKPFSNSKLNIAAIISVLIIALVLFTPISIPFGLIYLPKSLYLIGFLLSFVSVVFMEIAKILGLIRLN